jgi:hypothetical protein
VGKRVRISTVIGVRIPGNDFEDVHLVSNAHHPLTFSLCQQAAIHTHGVSSHE